ncbi:LacI family DNA-binding transcriptional regulator [Streptomyces formicae]|uniref:LacI family DNA-binding transcriptional regulator n=1 Tax=Streptomyces formicae TaxID=1616117 RepID=UPI001F5854E9|nr:LacI family DNA-binding transcriptional regulator [Streptomyces formicae]
MTRKPADEQPVRRRTTLHDVAARAGVSAATVSRVLNGTYRVSAETQSRVRRAAEELDYVVNAQARSLVASSSGLVAVLVTDITAPFYNRIAKGLAEQVTAEGRVCILSTPQSGDLDGELATITTLRQQSPEAIVLVGGVHESPDYRKRIDGLAHSLDAEGSRLVLCGRPSPTKDTPATVVEYDGEAGAFAITSHLLSAGHERILFLGGGAGSTTTNPRVRGYRRALEAYGTTPDPALIAHGSSTRVFGYEEMTRILASGTPDFTAVFASDDLAASGVLAALRGHGLRVPDDISVVGFDDTPVALDTVPSLTTVHVPMEEIGRTAIQLALHRHEADFRNAQHAVLGTHITVRDSVRPLVHKRT